MYYFKSIVLLWRALPETLLSLDDLTPDWLAPCYQYHQLAPMIDDNKLANVACYYEVSRRVCLLCGTPSIC